MKQHFVLFVFALCLLSGCTQTGTPSATATSTPPAKAQLEELKLRMNDAFAGLEMYASDNSLVYPDSLEVLIPRYLDAVPLDPVSNKPILYQKTEEGFLLSSSGDYSGLGAEAGFPKMNQDGFYVKSEEEFPKFE